MAENPSNIVPDQIILLEGGSKLVPAPSAGDSGKVLGVLNSDGDIGWTEGASSSDIFVAKYGVTPYSEIAAAITDGKDVVCMYVDSNNVTYTYTMTQHDASNQFVRFAWLKRNNDHTISNQGDSWYEITMQGTTWNNVSGPFPANLAFQADGSTTEATKAQNIVQFSVKNPLPDSTSADEDKVLTVDSNGKPAWATAQGGGGDWGRYTRYLRLDDPNDQTQWRSDTTITYGYGEAMVGSYYNPYPLSELFVRPNSTTGQIEPGFGWGCTYILSGLLPLVPPVGTIYDSLGTGHLWITDRLENPEDPMMEYERTIHKIPLTFINRFVGTSGSNEITATEFSVVIPPLSTSIDPQTPFQTNLFFHDPNSSRTWSVIPRTSVSNDIADKFKVYCTCIPSQYYTEVAIQS